MTNVGIVGSDGRAHALGWKISQNEDVENVFYFSEFPGNGGTEEYKGKNVPIGIKEENFPHILHFANEKKVSELIVSSENQLNDGIVDFFRSQNYSRIIGPTKRAARIETDKFYSYDLMKELGIPQAESVKCSTMEESADAISKLADENGIVIKARYLTKGKGVRVCDSKEEAISYLHEHVKKYGSDILVAKRLIGEEFSVFTMSDGEHVYPFDASFQDFKRLEDGNYGPNTGGIGSYGPAIAANKETVMKVAKEMMLPVVRRMKETDSEYSGYFYAGMMKTKDGLYVIEFNARLGDPETEPLVMMLESDLYESICLFLDNDMKNYKTMFKEGSACCVVLCSKGYPERPSDGFEIHGIENANDIDGVKVFHSGTVREENRIIAWGGRLLDVTAYSHEGIGSARDLVYKGVDMISPKERLHFRRDIAEM